MRDSPKPQRNEQFSLGCMPYLIDRSRSVDKQLFLDLCESLRQAVAISKGPGQPCRITVIKGKSKPNELPLRELGASPSEDSTN